MTVLLDIVRQAAGDLAAEVTDARNVRVLCPRGHFIADVAVVNLGELVLTAPLSGLEHPGFAAELAELAAAARLRPPRGTPGMLRRSDERMGVYSRGELSIECPKKKCAYRGSFEYFSFSAEVGAARHAEYRLTN